MSDSDLFRTLLVVGAILLFISLLLGLLGSFGGTTMMGWGMMAFGVPMFIGWLLFCGLVLGAGYLFLSGRVTGTESAERADRTRAREDTDDEALATLRDRYARGELDEEEFERKVESLLETESPERARDRIHDRER